MRSTIHLVGTPGYFACGSRGGVGYHGSTLHVSKITCHKCKKDDKYIELLAETDPIHLMQWAQLRECAFKGIKT